MESGLIEEGVSILCVLNNTEALRCILIKGNLEISKVFV